MKKNKVQLPSYISIDSLKLRVPINKVTDIDYKVIYNPHLEVSDITGEITNVKNKGQRIRISDSASIHVEIKKVKTTSFNAPTEHLIILLNSKILESRYFEGITKDNLSIVYDKLMKGNLFKFTWNTFINSEGTDIDWKYDEVLNKENRIDLVRSFNDLLRPERTDSVRTYIPRTENTKNNQVGIQFNYRERATTSKPFFKIYSKGSESIEKDTKSIDEGESPFFDSYFNYNDLKDICRIETTVKNKKMAKAIGLKSTRLGDLVNLSQENHIQIFQFAFSKYLNTDLLNNQIRPKTEHITPTDIIHFNSLVLLIKNTKQPIDIIVNSLVNNIDHKVSRSRQKKKLLSLYSEHIENTKNDVSESVKKIGKFWAKFGYS